MNTQPQLQPPELKLPLVLKSQLDIQAISLEDVPARYMNPGELEVLVCLMRSVKPKRVVEFGCNIGRTAKVILREVAGIQSYVGIDVFPGYQFKCSVQRLEVPQNPGYMATDDPRFRLMLSDRGSFDVTREDLGSADAVFIDGDHSYDAVMHDTELARSIINPGGIIIWHDYHAIPTVDVRLALEQLYSLGTQILHVHNTWLAFYRHTQ